MNHNIICKQINLIIVGTILLVSTINAQDSNELPKDIKLGMELFEGSTEFENDGPSCISCHNVTNDKIIAGGLFAKDLTGKNGAYVVSFAKTLPNAPMKDAYSDNEITEDELASLSVFFDYANEVKDSQKTNTGYSYFFIGGGIGLLVLFLLVHLTWASRKKRMVKDTIFARQNKAWDARF